MYVCPSTLMRVSMLFCVLPLSCNGPTPARRGGGARRSCSVLPLGRRLVTAPLLRHAASTRRRQPRGCAALHVWLRATSRRTLSLRVAVDVSETVVDVNDGFSAGLCAAASGPRVLGTRGAGSEAGWRRRACMLCLICPHRHRRWRAGQLEHLACARAHVLLSYLHTPV